MARKNWYIEVDSDDNVWYQFSAPEEAYPEAIGIGLGVSATLPAGARATRRGTYAHHKIMRVAIVLENGDRKIRLCDMDMLGTAINDLPSAAAFGSTIARVVPVRRNRLI
jgi:hypothetical protein